jgi:hypothetical protein
LNHNNQKKLEQMKTKIVFTVIVVLLVFAVVANRILGNKMAKEIDLALQAKLEKNELPVTIDYAKIKVNPLFSQVKVSGLSVNGPGEEGTFSCKRIDIDIPYKEALRLAESSEFEALNSIKIRLVQVSLISIDSSNSVEFDDLVADFNGQLTKADFENLDTRFPDKKQELILSFSGLKLNLNDKIYQNPPFSQLMVQLTAIDKGSYKLAYLPEKKELDIRDFSIESPVISYKGHATLKYEGDCARDFKPVSADMETVLRFEPKKFDWEDERGGKGEFQLGKLIFSTKSDVLFDQKTFPQGDMKLEVDNLSIHYTDKGNQQGGSMFNFSLNNLDVEKLDLNYRLSNDKLNISDSRLKSSILDADLYADVDIDNTNPANSTIKEAKLRAQNLSPELEKMLTGFERQMGKNLPREDDAIVLELTGKLARPTIKGFEF